MLILGYWIHWVSLITAFLLANLAFIFSGATEGKGKACIFIVVVLFDFLELPDELGRPEKTRGECYLTCASSEKSTCVEIFPEGL